MKQRIVSLLSSNTEMACALGLADRLVGISHECDFPPEILNLPRVTRTRIDAHASSAEINDQVNREFAAGQALYEIDEQALRDLEPDLILTQAQCEVCAVELDSVRAAVARIPESKRPGILSFQPNSIMDVFADMQRIARAAGIDRESKPIIAALRSRVDAAVEAMCAVPSDDRPRVLTLEWLDPPMPGGCWTPELVELAGGQWVLNAPGSKTRAFDWKAIGDCGAEVLILCPCGFKLDQTLPEVPALFAREEIQRLPAAQTSRIFAADGNAFFNRPGPRLVDTLELLCHLIHPAEAERAAIPLPAGMHLLVPSPFK